MASGLSSSSVFRKRRLVWHRNRDLRYHDHPFHDNNQIPTRSVFVFDDAVCCGVRPSTITRNDWMATNLGPHGARVLLESVEDLQRTSEALHRQGGLEQELIIRRGPTVPILLELIETLVRVEEHDKNDATPLVYEICWNEEPGWYELELSRQLRAAIQKRFDPARVRMRTTLSCTLYHPDDLPPPRSWQPLSKKEKRRLENQRKKERQLQNKPQPRVASSPQQQHDHQQQYTSPIHGNHALVDVSVDRWVGMPKIMGDFRRIARERAGVRACAADIVTTRTIETDDSSPSIDPGIMPTLESLLEPLLLFLDDDSNTPKSILGLPPLVIRKVCDRALQIYYQNRNNNNDSNHQSIMVGGESMALAHLHDFCANHMHRAQRSLACVDNHQSSHLGQYLAFGCLSPRKVIAVAEASIQTRKGTTEEDNSNVYKNDGTWLISHMTMRDFFLYTCLASGTQFYRQEGIPVNQKHAAGISWKTFDDPATTVLWESWACGQTGLPLVDACLRELMETGYASNRVRQNAASVLTKDLGIDWRAGAEWFQFLLSDHCVGANWGNWLYFSGVGPDPKQRHFCTVSQALKYDADGVYVRKWVSELASNTIENAEYHLRPWDFDDSSWKRPVVDPESQYTWRDLERLKERGTLLEQ